MRVKVDEDLPTDAVTLLRRHGHEADRVLDEGMGGWKDPDVWAAIQAEGRFLVTGDKGFGSILRYPPGTHAGVLILRPAEDGIRPIIHLLERVLATYELELLAGALTVANPRGIRIRRSRQH